MGYYAMPLINSPNIAFETKFYWINVKIDKPMKHTHIFFIALSMINEQKIGTHTLLLFSAFEKIFIYLDLFFFCQLVLQQQYTHHIDWHISMIHATEFFNTLFLYTRKSKIKNTINFVGR